MDTFDTELWVCLDPPVCPTCRQADVSFGIQPRWLFLPLPNYAMNVVAIPIHMTPIATTFCNIWRRARRSLPNVGKKRVNKMP
jgi:hypothetical protein